MLLEFLLVFSNGHVDVEAADERRLAIVDEWVTVEPPIPVLIVIMPITEKQVHRIKATVVCQLIDLVLQICEMLVQILLLLQSDYVFAVLPRCAEVRFLRLHFSLLHKPLKRLINLLEPFLSPFLTFFCT